MSGVIDDDGTQWERCTRCGKLARLTEMDGDDRCSTCSALDALERATPVYGSTSCDCPACKEVKSK